MYQMRRTHDDNPELYQPAVRINLLYGLFRMLPKILLVKKSLSNPQPLKGLACSHAFNEKCIFLFFQTFNRAVHDSRLLWV